MESLIVDWGYLALFLLTALSAFGVPVGSELAMAYGGALAGGAVLGGPHDHFSLGVVIVVAVVGELLGGVFGYGLGRFGGRPVVDRVGRFALLTQRDLDRAEEFLARRGDSFVFVGRLIPLVRSFVSIAAGLSRMPFWRFVAFSAAADAIFAAALCGLGYSLGGSWHTAVRGFSYAGYVAALVALLAITAGFIHRVKVVRHEQAIRQTNPSSRTPSGTAATLEPDHAINRPTVGGQSIGEGDRQGQMQESEEMNPETPHPRPLLDPPAPRRPTSGQLPVIGRLFPAPVAAKVPEIIVLFWVVKILTTAGGEAASDFLKTWGNIGGGGTELILFAVALVLQFGTRRYRAFAYWFLAYAIAIFGTGVSDFLHLDVHIPYAGTTLLWAVILAAIFWTWQHNEGTLSIHSITTQRREAFYWGTVFATFALGTALGDFTATSLNLGYLASGIFFSVVIFIPAVAWWRLGLNGVAAFWMSYVVTRPLGASFADYISKPRNLSGIGFGDGPTAVVFAVAVFILVSYLAIARPDIQPRHYAATTRRRPLTVTPEAIGDAAELEVS